MDIPSGVDPSLSEAPITPAASPTNQLSDKPVPISSKYTRLRKPRQERKAACTECRQQKLKCDAYLNPKKPCSRCSKLCLSCFQLPGFRRVEVRKARKRGVVSHRDSNIEHQTSNIRNDADSSALSVSSVPSDSGVFRTAPSHAGLLDSAPLGPYSPTGQEAISNQFISTLSTPVSSATQPRSLSDTHVDAKIIDECFEIFFAKFSPLLPIVTTRLVPNEYYRRSPTLFWAIVVVGSRSLVSDPTLLRGIAPEVLNLALTSFQLVRSPIDDIRGLLLLCTWPCPTTTLLRDSTVALSGMLLNLSMQAGLHIPSAPFAQLTGAGPEVYSSRQMELASLWVHVILACQGIMSLGGYPSVVCSTTIACCSIEKTYWQFVPTYLKLRYRAQAILSESQSAIIDVGPDVGSVDSHHVLFTRIKALETNLNNLELEFSNEVSPLDTAYMQSARLQLEVLRLYGSTGLDDQTELVKLFRTASGLVMTIKLLNDTNSIAQCSPIYLSTSLMLATFTLLRMLKSRFTQSIESDLEESGKKSFFAGIHMLKQISLGNNDVCAKCAEMLSVMWTNQALFKTPDPSNWVKLRIRNRFAMSVVFDTLLVWIEEYGYCNGGAALALRLANEMDSSKGDPKVLQCGHGPFSADDSPLLQGDDRWLYELDWNAGLDVLIAEQGRGNIMNVC